MSDDALIEAMARAIDASLYGNKLNAVYCYAEAKAALDIARPIIEAQERERCARIAERECLIPSGAEIAASIRDGSNE